MKIDDKFIIRNAMSKGFENHDPGDVPFVSNGFDNNGIIGFVKPLNNERVFFEPAICVSAFCEATVHKPPFIPRGNGGSGILILTPLSEMSELELYYYAAIINVQRWRFSYGRMVTGKRLGNIDFPEMPREFDVDISVEKYMPTLAKFQNIGPKQFELYPVNTIFDIERGEGNYFENYDEGSTPLISATMDNNGVYGYVDITPKFIAPKITINRISGNAFVQLEDFVTVPDDVFVLSPRREMCLEELLYFGSVIDQHKWRINYCRKLTPTRFNKLQIPLPIQANGVIDTNYIRQIVATRYGWSIIRSMC